MSVISVRDAEGGRGRRRGWSNTVLSAPQPNERRASHIGSAPVFRDWQVMRDGAEFRLDWDSMSIKMPGPEYTDAAHKLSSCSLLTVGKDTKIV